MLALFFLLLIFLLFCPLKFYFGLSVDFAKKHLSLQVKLFDFVKIISKYFYIDGVKIIDGKNKKPLKISFKDKKIDIKKALKLKTACVMFIFDYRQTACFLSAINSVVTICRQIYKDKFYVYFQNAYNQKLVAAEGIFCSSIADIIFRIITSFGVYLWKQLKIKLKKSSTA